jgi:hypothetical protein
MNGRTPCGLGPGLLVPFLALLLAGCEWVKEEPFQPLSSDKPPPGRPQTPQPASHPLTGEWIGDLGGAPLRLELVEAEDRSLSGVVVFAGTAISGEYAVRSGRHASDDTIFLDATPCVAPPPVGCTLLFEGVRGEADNLFGTFRGRMGHDPSVVLDWSAVRSAP